MKLKLVGLNEIEKNGQYIIRYDNFDHALTIEKGSIVIKEILDHFHIDEDDLEEYGSLENAFEACEERMGDGWNYLEVYEVIS